MWLYALFVLLVIAFTNAQALDHDASHFAGCYEVKSLTWSPLANDIKVIPTRVKLLNTPRGDGVFEMRSFGDNSNRNENFWWWRPESTGRVKVDWSSGLGGIRGTLKRSKNGDLKGKIKEWCDSRCGWKRRTGDLLLHPIVCATQ
jgi:hypothetical protein